MGKDASRPSRTSLRQAQGGEGTRTTGPTGESRGKDAKSAKEKQQTEQDKLTADLRRLTQKKTYSPQRRRGRRELTFCLSGDDDKQKHVSIRD